MCCGQGGALTPLRYVLPVGHDGQRLCLRSNFAASSPRALAEGVVGLRGALGVGVVLQSTSVKSCSDAAAGCRIVQVQSTRDIFGI